MLLVRQVFQAKYGRGDELVALFQEFNKRIRDDNREGPIFRVMTDASGPFFTIVTEAEVASFAVWEEQFAKAMSEPWMNEWFGKMMPLVDSGRRDFYTIVE